MVGRALRLFLLSLAHAGHRLRHDLAREMVVALCGLVLGGLFYYIFSDFLNHQVAELSTAMRQRFGDALAYALLASAALAAGRHIKAERSDERSFAVMAHFLGEEAGILRTFAVLRILSLLLLYFAPACWIALTSLVDWSWSRSLGLASAALLLSLLASLAPLGGRELIYEEPLLKRADLSPLSAMVLWRIKQMLWRNNACQAALVGAGALALLSGFFIARGAPALGPVLLAYLAGIMPAAALALQVSYDLPYAWIERNLGVSDRQYLRVLECLGVGLGVGVGSVLALSAVCGALVGGFAVTGLEILTLFAIAACPPFLIPYLVFQVDGRRVGIQLITLILGSLFLATALYASLFSLALFPFVAYYGVESQRGRFYRA